MIVTAAPQAPNMLLQISSPPASITGWRVVATWPEGNYVVRGTPALQAGGYYNLVDYQVPLSDPSHGVTRLVTYNVTAFTASGSATAGVTGAAVVYPNARLDDSERTGVGMDVVVADQSPQSWQPRTVFYDVLDRDDPVVAMQTARLRAGQLRLLTATQGERVQLRDLVRGGAPLLLRTTNPDRAEDTMFVALDVTSEDRTELDARRLWTISYQAVAIDQGAYSPPPTRTYATALADSRFPTYVSMVSYDGPTDVAYATYAAYLAGQAG